MHNFSSCVLDTSVIIKALFSPSHRQAGTTYSREVNTHKTCAALLAALDEKGIEGIIPQCGIVEIAAVSSRLADARAAEEICNEVEMSYQLVPEEQIIRTATKIAREEGCPGFDTYFLALAEQNALPLFTDDAGLFHVCQRRSVTASLMRDLDLGSVLP